MNDPSSSSVLAPIRRVCVSTTNTPPSVAGSYISPVPRPGPASHAAAHAGPGGGPRHRLRFRIPGASGRSSDLALGRRGTPRRPHAIVFQPGINERSGGHCRVGHQQVGLFSGATRRCVCPLVRQGPGSIMRRHLPPRQRRRQLFRYQSVLVVAGDDPPPNLHPPPPDGHVFKAVAMMPVLYPANVRMISRLRLARLGHEPLFRVLGGVQGPPRQTLGYRSASTRWPAHRRPHRFPDTSRRPQHPWRIPSELPGSAAAERQTLPRLLRQANGLNRAMIDSPAPRLGILTAGRILPGRAPGAGQMGIVNASPPPSASRLYKVGMVWPWSPIRCGALLEPWKILVVEEKRQLLEYQLKNTTGARTSGRGSSIRREGQVGSGPRRPDTSTCMALHLRPQAVASGDHRPR